ncbi:MAG: hypothetical protein INR65_00435 [Gluconacetobacter diazotrophicus]|nr:hypothetical protein [Gluconacetobacter diazotrophicus]
MHTDMGQLAILAVGAGATGMLLLRRLRLDRADPGRHDRNRLWMEEQVRLHHERVAEHERRKAAGWRVGPPPRMPAKVARMLYGISTMLPPGGGG